MTNRRIPGRPTFMAPHFRRDGLLVNGNVRSAHDRRAPESST